MHDKPRPRPDRFALRLLTIFADASWWNGAGGFAWWCRGDGEDRTFGSQPWKCDGIDEAETVGLAIAFFEAVDRLPVMVGGSILLQSDSISALGAFYALDCGLPVKRGDHPITRRRFNLTQQRFIERVKREAEERGLKIWLKHIKAHTGNEAPRYAVNAWCDREAKEARRLCARQMLADAARSPEEVEAAMRDAENRAMSSSTCQGLNA